MNAEDKEKYSDDEKVDLIVAASNDGYHFLKLLEEIGEAQQELVKFYSKTGEHKPNPEKVIEELAHLILRVILYCEKQKWSDKVEVEMEKKLGQLWHWYLEGKLGGNLHVSHKFSYETDTELSKQKE